MIHLLHSAWSLRRSRRTSESILKALLIAVAAGGTGQAQTLTVQVANHTPAPVQQIQVAINATTWSANRLSAPIPAGAHGAFAFSSQPGICVYDLKAVLSSGKSLTASHFNACAGVPWTVTQELNVMAAAVPSVLVLLPHPGAPVHNGQGAAPVPPPQPEQPQPEQPQPVQPVPPVGGDHPQPIPPGPPPAGGNLPQPVQPVPHEHAGNGGNTLSAKEATFYRDALIGAASYDIPRQMNVGATYPATATIYSPQLKDAAAGAHSLKVTPFMVVTLTAPNDPGDFTIDSSQDKVCQFIPDGDSTQWHFLVTPKGTGSSRLFSLHGTQTLAFTAYLVYGTDKNTCSPDNPMRRQLVSDTESVEIKAFGNFWERALDYIADNPGKSLLFLLGGGAGLPGLATLSKKLWEWYRKRRSAAKTHPEATTGATQP